MSTTERSSHTTPQRARTRPSAGYAPHLEVAVDAVTDMADLVRAITVCGADIRTMDTRADGMRTLTVACADTTQQDSVRAALGNIGPHAAMPVMEGKAVLFQQFAGIDAHPLCIDVSSVDEIVAVAKAIAPSFGGINLEDIAAPMCFEVEERLQAELDIPVFHDDQHGTAIVVLAALQNAAKAVGKAIADMTVVIVGTGAAGLAIGKLLHLVGVGNLIGVDREGILHATVLTSDSSCAKWWFATNGNRDARTGAVADALKGADALVGVSGPGVIDPAWLELMADDAIVCALANPVPEVMPEHVPANVAVMATGRSDYPNQINNVLAFPGVFRGMLDVRATRCTDSIKLAAADALAALVPDPTPQRILPGVFEPGVAQAVAAAVADAALRHGTIRPDSG